MRPDALTAADPDAARAGGLPEDSRAPGRESAGRPGWQDDRAGPSRRPGRAGFLGGRAASTAFRLGRSGLYQVGDKVVYPHHGAGTGVKKESREVLGKKRDYLTIKILHNDMTVQVPCENAEKVGLRRVIGEKEVGVVVKALTGTSTEMPKNWNRRFKHNRDKIKTGDIYELAEVVRNLALRESEKGLSTGEKQMFTRAKKILASELMYALDKDEDEAEGYLDELLASSAASKLAGVSD